MRATFYALSFIIGCCCGVGSFAAAYTLVDWRPLITNVRDPQNFVPAEFRHSGIVAAHDSVRKTITIREQSAFETSTSTGELRFVYDDETQWSSLEFIFRDNTMERRTITAHEQERPLPEGTLVWLVRDPTIDSPWRIAHLVFLRRTDL